MNRRATNTRTLQWLVGIASGLLASSLLAAETIKIAVIDPLSGPFANIGQSSLKHYQAAVDQANQHGGAMGIKLELVAFDNKSSPQEALLNLQAAIDRGIRFVTQGSGSNIALALRDAIEKHNERSPGRSIVYLNHGAVDTALTNEKCSFWHFRFDASGSMKLEALTSAIARDDSVRRVFLLNQDYAWGQTVSREAKEMLGRKRPDVQIVGDDLHPLGKVKDFAPYVSKVIESGADAVITGNWGNDLALLIRAARDAGAKAQFYTFYASLQGTPTAMGEAAADRVKTIITWHPNIENDQLEDYVKAFKDKYKEDWSWLPSYNAIRMLVSAIETARTTDPPKVARVMEGLSYLSPTGPVLMRKEDHQLIQPLYLATFARAGTPGVKYDSEGTGLGWRTDARVEADDTVLPTTCRMQRPQEAAVREGQRSRPVNQPRRKP